MGLEAIFLAGHGGEDPAWEADIMSKSSSQCKSLKLTQDDQSNGGRVFLLELNVKPGNAMLDGILKIT